MGSSASASASSSSSSSSLIIPLLLCLVSCLAVLSHATATDTLKPGQSLSTIDGSTLVSANGLFELGFFTPGKASNQYVAIWYHNISKQDTIWVANRESPVPASSLAFLVLTDVGNLELISESANGNVTIWSTNTSSLNTTTLQLSNEGNLIIQSSQNSILWQSFDHPGNTFIQGMHVGINTKTGARQVYTCWRSPDDPAPGNFSMGLDPSGSTQLFIWKDGTVPYWRSGEWNGASNFMGIPWLPLYSKGFLLVTDGDQKYYTYTNFNDSLERFVLQWNGTDSIYLYASASQGWDDFWNQPVKQCEIYGACGPNGLCRNNGNLASCSCLDGYWPKSNQDWKAGNCSGGCVRHSALGCQENNRQSEYKRLQGMKLPDHTERLSYIGDSDTCQSYCSSNCSCNAYAYVATVGCMTWSGDLIDLYHFDDGGYDLYVKAPHGSNNRKIPIIAGMVSAFVVLLLVVSIFLWRQFFFCSGPKGSLDSTYELQESTRGFLRRKEDCPKQSQLADEVDRNGNTFEVPLFTFDCIATATNNFSNSNKLGEGGFGLVYKGKLPGGEEIAVKRLSATSRQGIEELKNEVILVAKLQHRNLVRLLGCCIQGQEKLLVYEYLPNKSLDASLFDPSKRGLLDWRKRFNIIEGIARGLLYLHCDSRLRVVHRDLKASNILLDKNMEPKISDFGMARIFGGEQNQENTMRVVGTLGYMSPEYAMEGIFSVKSDVYSFGIVILEIITGERNSSFHNKEDSINIVGYAYKLWHKGNAYDLIDPTIRETCFIPEVLRCINVALLCVQDLAQDRPDILSVIKMIFNKGTDVPVPRQPTFTVQGYLSNSKAVKSSADYLVSECGVTITAIQGR